MRVGAANIHSDSRYLFFDRQPACPRDIVDTHKIPYLIAVLEDYWRLIVQQPRGKNGEYAGIWIRQRLMRAINVKKPQRNRRNVIRSPCNQAELLLVEFREGVYRRQIWCLPFRRGQRA